MPDLEFNPAEMVHGLPRDAIPAIWDPRFEDADAADMAADEEVIGVEVDGEARAYPISVLSSHEIVNDRVGGRPIAVTW